MEQLANLTIEADEVMVSFDVRSLFTSVPVEGAMHAIEENVSMDNLSLLGMLRKCLTTTAFEFRQNITN